jgi:nitroreductase
MADVGLRGREAAPLNADAMEAAIRKRRSIRKYKPDMPPPQWIEAMVACASMAPSPSNSQPVRFVRISSPVLREELREEMLRRKEELLLEVEAGGGSKKTRNLINVYSRYSEFLFEAPVVLCMGTAAGAETFSRKLANAKVLRADKRGETDPDISIGLAVMALMLKGESLGLGTCILTAPLVFLEDIEKRLGLEDMRVKCFVTVGFPAETPSPPERKPLSEVYREIR